MYITILVKQVYWYISQVADECLQDHWPSGFLWVCFHHFSSNVYTAYYVWDTSVISIQFVLEFRVSKNSHDLGIFISRVPMGTLTL